MVVSERMVPHVDLSACGSTVALKSDGTKIQLTITFFAVELSGSNLDML